MTRWFNDLPLLWKLLTGFGAVLALMVVLNTFAYQTTRYTHETGALVEHSHQVVDTAEDALVSLLNMETGYRGFLVTGQEEFLEPYNRGREWQAEVELRRVLKRHGTSAGRRGCPDGLSSMRRRGDVRWLRSSPAAG